MSIAKEIKALPMTPKDLRSFGWVVGGVFLGIAAYGWYRDAGWWQVVAGVGGTLVVLGTVVPKILRPVYIAWMSMAVVLGAIMTRILLTIFFFLILTPVGLVFKLIGRDALTRKIDRDASTYWIEKEYPIADRSRYENFF